MNRTKNLRCYRTLVLSVAFIILFGVQSYRYYAYRTKIRSELSQIFDITNDLKLEKVFLQEQLKLNYGAFNHLDEESVLLLSRHIPLILDKNRQPKARLVIIHKDGVCNNCFNSLISAVVDHKEYLLSRYSIHVMLGAEHISSPIVSLLKKTSGDINIHANVDLDALGSKVSDSYVYVLERNNTIGKIFVPNILYPDYQKIFLQGL